MTSEQSSGSSLFDHLLELRSRLLSMVLSVLAIFASLAYFAQDIYQYLAKPLIAVMPEGSSMIAKRGTAVRRISLDHENEKYIEGKVDGIQIVIITEYVKKL